MIIQICGAPHPLTCQIISIHEKPFCIVHSIKLTNLGEVGEVK